MRKPGKSSRERNADFCSNHNDDEDKYFFKVLVGDFRERLVIPDKFEQHFRGLIANNAKLESRCGYTFDVEVAKNLGKVVLQTGWKEFVTAHDLNMGDLLVFKYDGTSRFKVLIFGLSCCEKMPPCHVKRNHIRGRERREELPVKSPGSKREAWKQREGNMNVIPSSSTSPSDTSEDQKLHCQGYILPRETRLTCVQMKKLKERVRANSSTIPIYGCIITKSSIHGKMAMICDHKIQLDWKKRKVKERENSEKEKSIKCPRNATVFDVGVVKMRKPGKRSRERHAYFCSNHKDEKDKYFFKVLVGDFRERLAIPDKFMQHFRRLIANSVKIESRCGHTFDVEVAKNLGKVVLQTGWKEFVTAHDLNMGDFLVFKYDGTSRLKVFIFDLSCCEKVPPCLVKRNHTCGRETRKMHIEISSSCGDLPLNVTASSSTSPSDSSGDSVSPEDQKSHYVPGYILPKGTYLTCVQMKKLKERVRTSTSTIPIYGCIVKKSNLRRGSQAMHVVVEQAFPSFMRERATISETGIGELKYQWEENWTS
ncbi:unnamed protein product [Miscanthus lutarioriparius]|uniref:TF-B3 domain-containing protein n=1 Tax=Miscanthus lutarioriparius TaxID=422564 RepID=A0A811MI50_9POAL|nr:unnamed protein product [Miscanthus lutarioriparius]